MGVSEAREMPDKDLVLRVRQRLGWSQPTLGQALKVTRQMVSEWERGKRVLSEGKRAWFEQVDGALDLRDAQKLPHLPIPAEAPPETKGMDPFAAFLLVFGIGAGAILLGLLIAKLLEDSE